MGYIEVIGFANKDLKINNIKDIRDATGYGLKESKEIVEEFMLKGKAYINFFSREDGKKIYNLLNNYNIRVGRIVGIDRADDANRITKELVLFLLDKSKFDLAKRLLTLGEEIFYALKEDNESDILAKDIMV
jgi:hypothetical protein